MYDNLEKAVSKYDATIKIENYGKTRCFYCHSNPAFNEVVCLNCFCLFCENPPIVVQAVISTVALNLDDQDYGEDEQDETCPSCGNWAEDCDCLF